MNFFKNGRSPSRYNDDSSSEIKTKTTRKISVRSVIKDLTARLLAHVTKPGRNAEKPPPPPVSSLSQYTVVSERSEQVYSSLRQHRTLRATRSDPFLGAHASYLGLQGPSSPSPVPPDPSPASPTPFPRPRTRNKNQRSQSALENHTPTQHAYTQRTPRPKPCYPGPSRRIEIDQSDTRYMSKLTRTCAACGLQNWQCANASNYTGNEWHQFPRIDVRVAPKDHERVLQYYKQHVIRVPSRADSRPLLHGEGKPRSSRKIKLYVVPRNGCEDRPVEVRIGVKIYERRGAGRGADTKEKVEVFICEGKRAEIVHYMREQIEEMRFGRMATAYLVDRKGEFRAEALLVKEVSWS